MFRPRFSYALIFSDARDNGSLFSSRRRQATATSVPSGHSTVPSAFPVVLGLLKRRFGEVHPLAWDYFVLLDQKRKLLDSGAWWSKGVSARDSEIKWRAAFSIDFDLAETVARHLESIMDATALIQSSAGMSPSEVSELAQLCADEQNSAINALASIETDIVSTVAARVNSSDTVSNASKDWVFEVTGKAGGVEAGLFARDLVAMYKHYCESVRGWRVEEETGATVTESNVLRLSGLDVYHYLHHELGIHKVQRVPVTDHEGKMQTSTVVATLLPIVDPGSVNVHEADCKMEFVRGSGPGGQGMQSSSNACCLTHIPSGISVKCHQSRSATGNKLLALEMVAQQLWKRQVNEHERMMSTSRSAQNTTGERSDKIRTYNFPQNRVTDHRIGRDFPLGPFMTGGPELSELHDIMNQRESTRRTEVSLQRCIAEEMSVLQ